MKKRQIYYMIAMILAACALLSSCGKKKTVSMGNSSSNLSKAGKVCALGDSVYYVTNRHQIAELGKGNTVVAEADSPICELNQTGDGRLAYLVKEPQGPSWIEVADLNKKTKEEIYRASEDENISYFCVRESKLYVLCSTIDWDDRSRDYQWKQFDLADGSEKELMSSDQFHVENEWNSMEKQKLTVVSSTCTEDRFYFLVETEDQEYQIWSFDLEGKDRRCNVLFEWDAEKYEDVRMYEIQGDLYLECALNYGPDIYRIENRVLQNGKKENYTFRDKPLISHEFLCAQDGQEATWKFFHLTEDTAYYFNVDDEDTRSYTLYKIDLNNVKNGSEQIVQGQCPLGENGGTYGVVYYANGYMIWQGMMAVNLKTGEAEELSSYYQETEAAKTETIPETETIVSETTSSGNDWASEMIRKVLTETPWHSEGYRLSDSYTYVFNSDGTYTQDYDTGGNTMEGSYRIENGVLCFVDDDGQVWVHYEYDSSKNQFISRERIVMTKEAAEDDSGDDSKLRQRTLEPKTPEAETQSPAAMDLSEIANLSEIVECYQICLFRGCVVEFDHNDRIPDPEAADGMDFYASRVLSPGQTKKEMKGYLYQYLTPKMVDQVWNGDYLVEQDGKLYFRDDASSMGGSVMFKPEEAEWDSIDGKGRYLIKSPEYVAGGHSYISTPTFAFKKIENNFYLDEVID